MKHTKNKSFLSKILIVTLSILATCLVVVGCKVKSGSSSKKAQNVLSPVSFSVVSSSDYTKYNIAEETYSGALVSSTISQLPDKTGEGLYPTIQLNIDGRTENFYISKCKSGTEYSGSVSVGNHNLYLSSSDGGTEIAPERARIILEQNNNLHIVVHPNLSSSTSFARIVRGRALAAHGTKYKQSSLSSATTIKVRKLTFTTHSYNSIDPQRTYGYLSYNEKVYDFSVFAPSGTTNYTYLEGYFVDGRIVNITRHMLSREGVEVYDYDFQSWTVDSPANQFVAVARNNAQQNFYAPYETTTNRALSNGVNVGTEKTQDLSAWDNNLTLSGSTYKYENNPKENTISVMASTTTHKRVFYANYVKINNFSLSGRVFNGDAISISQTRLIGLSGVEITIHDNLNHDGTEYTTTTDANGNFEITGLSQNAYITFYYEGDGTEETGDYNISTEGVVYKFVSGSFAEETKEVYVGVTTDSATPLDRENISVTGSALPEGSDLNVQINFVDADGNILTDTDARYEYVKGVTESTEYFNADGKPCTNTDAEHHHGEDCIAYITTTILVSVIPGQNKLITSYALATSQNNSQLLKVTLTESDETDYNFKSGEKYYKITNKQTVSTFIIGQNCIEIPKSDVQGQYDKYDMHEQDITYQDSTNGKLIYFGNEGIANGKTIYYFAPDTGLFEEPQNTNTTIKGTVYESLLETKDHKPIYLYYSIQEGNDGNLYYIDPVGYKDEDTTGSGTIHPIQEIVANLDALAAQEEPKVVFGEDILFSIQNGEPTYSDFKSAAGNIRSSYYYYVAPLTEAKTAYIRVEDQNTTLSLDSLTWLADENLDNYSNSSYAHFVVYNSNSIELSSEGINYYNKKYYYTIAIGQQEGENFHSFGTYTLPGNVIDSKEGSDESYIYRDYYSTSNPHPIVAATGKYIREYINEHDEDNPENELVKEFKEFLNAGGYIEKDSNNNETLLIEDNYVYFIANLTVLNENTNPLLYPTNIKDTNTGNFLTAQVYTEYAYAFLENGSTNEHQYSLSRENVEQINVLGKFVVTSDGFSTINTLVPLGKPSYTSYQDLASVLAEYHVNFEESNATKYNIQIDQTISGSEIQGALGVVYLSGTPYPNPVFRFVVRHARRNSTVTLNVTLQEIYYVEVLGTLAQRETSDVVVDFSTYTFREKAENIAVNQTKYINKQTAVLTANGLHVVTVPVLTKYTRTENGQQITTYNLNFLDLPVDEFATYNNKNEIFYLGSSNNILPFVDTETKIFYTSISNGSNTLTFEDGVWKLNGEALSIATGLSKDNNVVDALKALLQTNTKNTAANKEDYVVWSSSNEAIENVAYFDIHTYDPDKFAETGLLELTSDCDDPCIGLLNLDEADILDPNNSYDTVAIAGLTSVYRISKADALRHTQSTSGYYSGTALTLEDALNATDPFFMTATDAVVAIARPIVKIETEANKLSEGVYYRFKEWKVYKRFNSQVIVEHHDATINEDNSILYFFPKENETGYFLLLPVYERMYTVSVGKTTNDGTLNNGGNIGIGANTFYTLKQAQTHVIKSYSTDYVVNIKNTISYFEVNNEYYYIQSETTARDKFNNVIEFTNENGYAIYVGNNTGPEITTSDVTKIISASTTDSIKYFFNNGTTDIEMLYDAQFSALKPTYTIVDKYGTENDIEPNEFGEFFVDGQKVAELVAQDTYYFEGHLSAEELISEDKNDQISISPTTYLIDRHTEVTLVASSSNGYRFDNWYLVVEDTETGAMLRSSLAAFSSSSHFMDEIKLPTNIVLLENEQYYRYVFSYNKNDFNGKFELQKVQDSYKSGDYVLFGGRLYYSDSVVEGNMLTSLEPYSNATGVNYDNFIEYFNYETQVKVVDNLSGYSAGSRFGENNEYLVTRVLPYETNEQGLTTKWAVHYTNTSILAPTIFDIKNGAGPNSALSGYRATEVFAGVNSANDGYFFVAQSTQNGSTLVPTRVTTKTEILTIENIDGKNTLLKDGQIFVDLTNDELANGKVKFKNGTTEKTLANIEYIMFGGTENSGPNQYVVVANEDTNEYYITRYFLYVVNDTYYQEVFNYNESAQTYTAEWNGTQDNVLALQYPVVDLIVNQIAALDENGANMGLTYSATGETSGGNTTYTYSSATGNALNANYTVVIESVETSGSVVTGATGYYYNNAAPSSTFAFNFAKGSSFTFAFGNQTRRTVIGMELSDNTLTMRLDANSYELSSTLVYQQSGTFYRTKIAGEVDVSGNMVTLNSLGRNYFIVANFVEYHHIIAQTESDSIDSTVEIAGMFYFNETNNENLYRSYYGTVVTNDPEVDHINLLTKDASGTYTDATYGLFGYKNGSLSNDLTDHPDYYTYSAVYGNDFINAIKTVYNPLTKQGGYALQNGHAVPKSIANNHWLDFDTGTSLIIVVRASKGTSLSAASLGLAAENIGNLEYLLYPTEAAIQNLEYTFYVIRIDLNHNLDNVYLEALEHPHNKTLVLKNVSKRAVYYDGTNYYFGKIIEQTENAGIITTTGAKYFDALTDTQKAYVATKQENGHNRYYFVPSLDLPEGASWVNETPTEEYQVSYYDKELKGLTTVSASTMRALIEKTTDIEYENTDPQKDPRQLKIHTGRPGNYLNLSSIPLYEFKVFAMPMTSASGTFNKEAVIAYSKDYNTTSSAPAISFGDQTVLWAAGGRATNAGQLRILGLDNPQGIDTILSQTFYKYEISNQDYFNVVMQPLVLCVDTMLTLSAPATLTNGIVTAGGVTYRFAGWYQLKQTGTNPQGEPTYDGSDLTFLGSQENLSPVVADANTIVVALYKEVQGISITFESAQIEFESNMPVDSIGNNFASVSGTETTLSGKFDYDANLVISFTAAPGYRLNTISGGNGHSFSGDLTTPQAVIFNGANGLNGAATYTVNAVETTTTVIKITNYMGDGANDHQIQVVDKDNQNKVYFNTNWLDKTQNNTWNNSSAATDSTNNKATVTYNTETGELVVILIFDQETEITLLHNETANAPTNSSNPTQFVGWNENGNPQQNTNTTYDITLQNSAVEYSATISQITSLAINIEILDAGENTALVDAVKTELETYFSLAYTNNRYTNTGSTYTTVTTDSQPLVHGTNQTDFGGNLFSTFYFDYNSLISLSITKNKVFTAGGYNIMFIGFKEKDGVTHSVINYAVDLSEAKNVTLSFALASTLSITTESNNNANADFNVVESVNVADNSGVNYYFAHTLPTALAVNNLQITGVNANENGSAIVEKYTITIGGQSQYITNTSGTLTFSNTTITYTCSADLTGLTITLSGAPVSVVVTAVINIGYVIE